MLLFRYSAALAADKNASKPAHIRKFRESENTMGKASDEGRLNLEDVRLVADLRIMHAKVYELFEVVSVIKKRHDENAIRRCSDHAMLDQDIKRMDDIYLWFVRLKEEGIRLTKK
jgi:hypothetical protein